MFTKGPRWVSYNILLVHLYPLGGSCSQLQHKPNKYGCLRVSVVPLEWFTHNEFWIFTHFFVKPDAFLLLFRRKMLGTDLRLCSHPRYCMPSNCRFPFAGTVPKLFCYVEADLSKSPANRLGYTYVRDWIIFWSSKSKTTLMHISGTNHFVPESWPCCKFHVTQMTRVQLVHFCSPLSVKLYYNNLAGGNYNLIHHQF